jgi:hypothetical protein
LCTSSIRHTVRRAYPNPLPSLKEPLPPPGGASFVESLVFVL